MTAPADIQSNPALLYLYYRVDKSLGIRTSGDSLLKLNDYLEKQSGYSFTENPQAFENILGSPQKIFEISNFLTINETYFFREGVHFEVLAKLLPQFAKLNRSINILSAATSIGCEAYSIAMLFDYHKKKGHIQDFSIDAFDINEKSIETAKNGRYTANAFRNDGADWKYIMDLYLVSDKDEFIVSKDIQSKVHFFTHNIMNDLNKQYDVIFFRNSLIYFLPKNRPDVIDNLAKSLFNNGYLFIGISETSSVDHPQLASQFFSDAFFFQKTTDSINAKNKTFSKIPQKSNFNGDERRTADRRDNTDRRAGQKQPEFPINYLEVCEILETEEGQPNAKNIYEILLYSEGRLAASLTGSELAAAAVYFLSVQEFNCADLVLSYLEKCNFGTLSLFLRGEYHMLQENIKEAEIYYDRACGKDGSFWPAFYRIASLAAEGNPTRYIYKIKKACESLELGRNSHYECLMGGFSPDYFKQILEKKLT